MPPAPNKDDLGATWRFLEEGVEKIMMNLKDGVDMSTYMGIYTAVHNFCTSQKAVASGGGIIGGNAHRGGTSSVFRPALSKHRFMLAIKSLR